MFLQMNVHSTLISNRQKLETTRMSINREIGYVHKTKHYIATESSEL